MEERDRSKGYSGIHGPSETGLEWQRRRWRHEDEYKNLSEERQREEWRILWARAPSWMMATFVGMRFLSWFYPSTLPDPSLAFNTNL